MDTSTFKVGRSSLSSVFFINSDIFSTQHRIQRPGGGEGARNMKSMWPPLAAIFFMTCLYRAGGGGAMAPSAPPGSATGTMPLTTFPQN